MSCALGDAPMVRCGPFEWMSMSNKTALGLLMESASTAPQDIGRENAASFDVYRQLRNDIIACRLRPNERLRFDALRTQYGAGVGTLREALSHLVSDGLVRIDVGRGFRVAPVSTEDLADITKWRIEFEVRAITESIQTGGDDWEAEIVAAFHVLVRAGMPTHVAPSQEWAAHGEKHTRFHNALAASCHSPWLNYFRNILIAQAHRYQALATIRRKPLLRGDEEHRSLMDAVILRDEKLAAKLITQHIRHTADVVTRVLLDNSAEFLSGSDGPVRKAPARRSRLTALS
jgi:GntR family transcriptional regulator, carbon starvation induced regulator